MWSLTKSAYKQKKQKTNNLQNTWTFENPRPGLWCGMGSDIDNHDCAYVRSRENQHDGWANPEIICPERQKFLVLYGWPCGERIKCDDTGVNQDFF